jgi:predicted dehydrogenase
MKLGIVGCGLIGCKRGAACKASDKVVAVADLSPDRAASLAKTTGAGVATWQALVRDPEIEAVLVATTNDALAEVSIQAIENGKAVLVEKPAARSVRELQPVIDAAARNRVVVHVGFNYRFHPALSRAREMVKAGEIGPLMFIRGRHGHGGRLGYDREWRANPEIAGGGEALDQGVHLIDLSRWFLGEFSQVCGHAATYFWNMPAEDNSFLSLRTAQGQTAWLHVGWTEWKNIFSFEIYGRTGKLQIDGLGGSYGVERLTFYRMLPQMGPPETTAWEFPGPDLSWSLEFEAFEKAVRSGIQITSTLADAKAALEVVGNLYGQPK